MIPGRNHQMILSDAARPGDPARQLILHFIAEHVGTPPGGAPFAVHAGSSSARAGTQVAFRQEDDHLSQVLDFLSGNYTPPQLLLENSLDPGPRGDRESSRADQASLRASAATTSKVLDQVFVDRDDSWLEDMFTSDKKVPWKLDDRA
jgi:hypothetical protein